MVSNTFGDDDVEVSGPNKFRQAAVRLYSSLSSNQPTLGHSWDVSYRITPPGGLWDAVDVGTYTIATLPGGITDSVGYSLEAGDLGSFQVSIPGNGPDLGIGLRGRLPDKVLGGQTGSIAVSVANTGNLPFHGSVPVRLDLSASQSGTTSDVPITALYTPVLTLNPLRSKTLRLIYRILPSIPDGDYYLRAIVDPNGGVAELNENNNTDAAATPTRAVRAVVDVKADVAEAPPVIGLGRRAGFSLRITNIGSIPAHGPMFARLFLSADQKPDATDPLLGFTSQTLSVAPGNNKTIHFSFVTPQGIAPGQYYFLADLGVTALLDSNGSNNVVFSGVLVQ